MIETVKNKPIRLIIVVVTVVGSLFFAVQAQADGNPPPTETPMPEQPLVTVEGEPTQPPLPIEVPPTDTPDPYPPADSSAAAAELPPIVEEAPPTESSPQSGGFLSGMSRYVIAGIFLVTLVLGVLIVMNVMRKTRQ
jgi:hypothetical protein